MPEFRELTDNDGEYLVKTARQVVTEHIQNNSKLKLKKDFEERYSYNSGVFVTLNDKSGLRGCIGYPLPHKKLFNALADAAIAAATEDPRFPRVTRSELEDILFEVTVLTPPEVIKVKEPSEYPSKIKIGRDGLIVKHSFYSGLLLPQVAVEYGWDEKEFLEYTCEKAGLERNFWKNKDVEISKFQGIVFKEETPNGRVVRERL